MKPTQHIEEGVALKTEVQVNQERIDRILEQSTTKHTVKKIVHSVTGHPKDRVYWGNAIEGATCACGAHWTNADMRM